MTDLYEQFAVPVDPEFKAELKAQLDARRIPSEGHTAPTTAPRTEEVTVVLKPVSQSRHSWRLVGLIAAAVVAVGAAGTVLVLATGDDDSGQGPAATLPMPSPAPPSVAPTTAPAVSVPVGWSDYTSSRFGYSIQHPQDWLVTPATKDWPSSGFPDPLGTEIDRFAPGADSPLFVFVSSVSNDVGQVALANWSLAKNSGASGCEISDDHTVSVDGARGHQDYEYCFDRDYVIEVLVTSGEQFYQIDMFSDAPFTDDQRRMFDQMLASFRFAD